MECALAHPLTGSPVCLLFCASRYYNQTDKQILDHMLQPDRFDRHNRPAGKCPSERETEENEARACRLLFALSCT